MKLEDFRKIATTETQKHITNLINPNVLITESTTFSQAQERIKWVAEQLKIKEKRLVELEKEEQSLMKMYQMLLNEFGSEEGIYASLGLLQTTMGTCYQAGIEWEGDTASTLDTIQNTQAALENQGSLPERKMYEKEQCKTKIGFYTNAIQAWEALLQGQDANAIQGFIKDEQATTSVATQGVFSKSQPTVDTEKVKPKGCSIM